MNYTNNFLNDMTNNKKIKRLTIEVSLELHQIIKIAATQNNLTIKEMIEKIIIKELVENK